MMVSVLVLLYPSAIMSCVFLRLIIVTGERDGSCRVCNLSFLQNTLRVRVGVCSGSSYCTGLRI